MDKDTKELVERLRAPSYTADDYQDMNSAAFVIEQFASRTAVDESAKPVEDRLRRLMGTVNAYEKATGVGGWYAENIQEQCNGLLKAIGSTVRFGLGSENPIEAEPASTASKEAKPVCPICNGHSKAFECSCQMGEPAPVASKEAVTLSDAAQASIESIDVKAALEVYRKDAEKDRPWWASSSLEREAGFVYGFRCALGVVMDRLGIEAQRDASKAEGQ